MSYVKPIVIELFATIAPRLWSTLPSSAVSVDFSLFSAKTYLFIQVFG